MTTHLRTFLRDIAVLTCLTLAHGTASATLVINEVDSDSTNTPTTDAFEFLELFNTLGTTLSLDGYVLVFYNGATGLVYRAEDLDGLSTDANGYFLAGSIAGVQKVIPGNTIQNGVDAIGLYLGDATAFPNGAAVTTTSLVDAVIYKTGADTDGTGLGSLLIAGPIVDEFGRDGTAAAGIADSIGRFANGSGGLRDTTNWTFMPPTPGSANIPEPSGLLLSAAGAVALLGRARRRR